MSKDKPALRWATKILLILLLGAILVIIGGLLTKSSDSILNRLVGDATTYADTVMLDRADAHLQPMTRNIADENLRLAVITSDGMVVEKPTQPYNADWIGIILIVTGLMLFLGLVVVIRWKRTGKL